MSSGPKVVLPGAVRLSAAALLIFSAGVIASYIPLPGYHPGRLFATLKLAEAGLASLIVAWPLMVRTGSVTAAEKQALYTSLKFSRSNC